MNLLNKMCVYCVIFLFKYQLIYNTTGKTFIYSPYL